ncbi:MAG: helical backbone metal receptor [Bacteroidales bacterium]|jgi:iron complex transport system substrate-binding protein|nr:helical backbone metal receptor [Bacteroidales bacterium]
MKKIFFIIISIMMLATSCRQKFQTTSSDQPIVDSSYYFECNDSYQHHIVLHKEPLRIISLSPSITEMLLLLNEEKRLIAITDYCPQEAALASIQRLGGLQNINIETLLALHPDLILYGSIVSKQDVEKMEKAGLIAMSIKEEKDIEGLFSALSILGQICRCDSVARTQITDLRQRLLQVASRQATHKKVYYVVGFGNGGDYTAPGNSHIDNIITLAGGINIGRSLTTWKISREYIFSENPDVIMIRQENYDAFIHTYPYTLLKAVKNHQVFPIRSEWIDIVSPHNIEAIELINSKIANI